MAGNAFWSIEAALEEDIGMLESYVINFSLLLLFDFKGLEEKSDFFCYHVIKLHCSGPGNIVFCQCRGR